MQLQVECNSLFPNQQLCWICNQSFEMREARVIICDSQGDNCGEVCPQCLSMGFNWINNQFQHLSQRNNTVRNDWNKKTYKPVKAEGSDWNVIKHEFDEARKR